MLACALILEVFASVHESSGGEFSERNDRSNVFAHGFERERDPHRSCVRGESSLDNRMAL